MFDTISYCISREKIMEYFLSSGYNVITLRKFILKNFDYKNSQEIIKDTGARESLLRVKLVYKDSELFDLKTKVSDLLDYMKQDFKDGKGFWWHQTRQVLFIGDVYNLRWMETDKDKLVGGYEFSYRFKAIIKEKIKNLINIEEDKEDGRYIIF